MKEQLSIVENTHSLPLDTNGFRIVRGWNETLAKQLVSASQEDIMIQRVPRDAGERFSSETVANHWHDKNERIVYSLGQKATLAGVIWYTKTPRPELNADYTFAIRMYEAARGRGMAQAFIEAAQQDFETASQYEGDVWLETDADNIPALVLYQRAGYEAVHETDTRITMVRKGVANLTIDA